MRRLRRGLVSLLALALTALVVPAADSAGAPPGTDIDPSTLPVGAAPEGTYLIGDLLHEASGSTFKLPFPAATNQKLWLLSGSDRRNLVVMRYLPSAVNANYPELQLWSIRGPVKSVFYNEAIGDSVLVRVLAQQDGKRLALFRTDRGGSSFIMADRLGHRLGRRNRIGSASSLLELTPDGLTTSGLTGVWSWQPGTLPVRLSKEYTADFADADADVLAVQPRGDGPYFTGLTTLSSPSTPAWLRRGLHVAAVSPDHSMVVGRLGRDRVAVLDATDGTELQRWQLTEGRPTTPMWWESDTAVVFQVKTSDGRALVRCQTTNGRCERATDWITGSRQISVPYVQTGGWFG